MSVETKSLNELVADYNSTFLKRYFINEVDCDEGGSAYVITDALNKSEPIVKVVLDMENCYRQVCVANEKYRECFYGEGSIQKKRK